MSVCVRVRVVVKNKTLCNIALNLNTQVKSI